MSAAEVEIASDCRFRGRVDEDAAVAYGLAANDPNPLYAEGLAVPPLFTATLILPSFAEAARTEIDPASIEGWTGSVHGEHDVHFWNPVLPGMELRWDTSFHGMTQSRGGVLSTLRILVSTVDGTPLVEHHWSNFYIGGRIPADVGMAKIDHTFPEDARSRPVAHRRVAVDRDQAYRYAGVSGDHAPHAMDDEAARAEGYPSKILQGMCTFALCSGAVVDAVAGGDPRRLRRLAGRFAAPAFPKQELAVDLYDAGTTDDGGKAFAFEAVQAGATVLKHGRVELLPG